MREENTVKTGTTTVGIFCKDGIVLAADKRSTVGMGYIYSKKEEKIIIINEDIAVTIAGVVSDIQLLVKLLQAELQIKKMRKEKQCTLKEAANLLGRMVYQNIRKFSVIAGLSQFILAGKDDAGLHMYEIYPDGSVTKCEDYRASGSGSILGAYSILDTNYKKNMSVDEGIKLAMKAVNAAWERDSASGGGIDVVVVTSKEIKKVLTRELETKLTI